MRKTFVEIPEELCGEARKLGFTDKQYALLRKTYQYGINQGEADEADVQHRMEHSLRDCQSAQDYFKNY